MFQTLATIIDQWSPHARQYESDGGWKGSSDDNEVTLVYYIQQNDGYKMQRDTIWKDVLTKEIQQQGEGVRSIF